MSRLSLEDDLIGPLHRDVLKPERMARMAKEMQEYYAERMRAMQSRATEAPKDLQELAARIERLRERLRKGDPDMPPDEIEAALERAEGKRRELEAQLPEAQQFSNVLSILPKAAELFTSGRARSRRQSTAGWQGSSDFARVVLRTNRLDARWRTTVGRVRTATRSTLASRWFETIRE